MVAFAVAVKILYFLFFQVGGVELVTGPVCAVELRAGDHVLEPAAIEGLTLSGLGKFEIQDEVRFPIYFYLEALSQFTCGKNGSHLLVLSSHYFI